MAKKRTTIFIDELVLQMAKDAAWEGRVSVSAFIEDAIRAKVDLAVLGFMKPKEAKKPKESSSDNGGKFFNPRPKK